MRDAVKRMTSRSGHRESDSSCAPNSACGTLTRASYFGYSLRHVSDGTMPAAPAFIEGFAALATGKWSKLRMFVAVSSLFLNHSV
jgi:hypothetical protein